MNYMNNYMSSRTCMPNVNSQPVRPMHNNTHSNSSCNPPAYTTDCFPEPASRECRVPEIPTGNQKQLFHFINEVSFAAYEALLFLDTHPDDADALAYFHKYNHLRNAALKEYAKCFGPLTISTADDCSFRCWEWMNQPWPWEGGIC